MTEGTAAAARIRVLPGSALSLPAPPPPPSQPPPQPVQLVKLAVIGDASSGKSSLVDKFLIRKSANQTNGSTTNNNSSGVHWCNASATSNGTFGSALGASLGPSSVATSLAEYYKKDIALKKKKRVKHNMQDTHHHDDDETTCVRAQVWDINVPQSAIINNQGNINNISNNSNSPEDTLSSSNSVNSTFSITSSPTATNTPQQQQHNNADNNLANLAPLLPLLKRINGIIITCQCPSPPSITIPLLSSNTSHASYHSQPSSNKSNTNNGEWAELDLLEVQIANWVKFIKSHVAMNGGGSGSSYNNGSGTPNSNNGSSSNNSSSNNPYKVFVILTFADLAITEYSPKEWMRVSVKMEEICAKFGIYSWRMGTCVCSGDCDVAENYNCDSSSIIGNDGGDRDHDGVGAENNNNFIVKQQQQRQQQKRQYRLLQRMAQQQQQLMEEMEDSVEALFIDMILVHLDGTCRLNDDVS